MSGNVKLRAWRERAGLKQEAAARDFGVSVFTWCRWENGRQLPDVELAVRLEKHTGGRVKVTDWHTATKETA